MFGLILLVLGSYTVLSNVLWTVYRSGKNAGWETDVLVSVLVTTVGVFLCRKALAGRPL